MRIFIVYNAYNICFYWFKLCPELEVNSTKFWFANYIHKIRIFDDYIVYNHFRIKKMEVPLSPKYCNQYFQKNKAKQSQTACIIFQLGDFKLIQLAPYTKFLIF